MRRSETAGTYHGGIRRARLRCRAEFEAAMAILGARPVTFDYVNGVSMAHPENLAVHEGKEAAFKRWREANAWARTTESVLADWTAQAGDSVTTLLELYRQVQPTVILALDPEHGYTTHPEHIAVTYAALQAARTYRAEAAMPFLFYAVHNPKSDVPGAERIDPTEINARGDKDYVAVAHRSWMCYPSQNGPIASGDLAEHIGDGCEAFVIEELSLA